MMYRTKRDNYFWVTEEDDGHYLVTGASIKYKMSPGHFKRQLWMKELHWAESVNIKVEMYDGTVKLGFTPRYHAKAYYLGRSTLPFLTVMEVGKDYLAKIPHEEILDIKHPELYV